MKKNCYAPLTALLGHPVQTILFTLIKTIFLQTQVEIILGPPTNKMKIFTYEVLGIKIG